MSTMYESWLAGGEVWEQTSVLMTLRSRKGSIGRGVRAWLNLEQMIARMGKDTANAIVAYKEATPALAHEIRFHPDAPNNPARAS